MNSKNYFSACATPDQIKKEYHRLAMANHPDRHPDDPNATETIKAINGQYTAALLAMDGHTATGSDGSPHKYHYNEEHEKKIMDKIAELLALDLPEAVSVFLVGKWIWIEGTAREDKPTQKLLKSAGCSYHGKRKCWYWKPYKVYYGRRNRNAGEGIGDIKSAYNSEQFKQKPAPAARAMVTA